MDKLLYAVSVGIDAVREIGTVTYINSVFRREVNIPMSHQVKKVQSELHS